MKALLKNINEHLKDDYDVFIASSSYEDRCLSIYKAIDNKVNFAFKLVSLSTPHKSLMEEKIIFFEEQGFKIIQINNSNQIGTISNFINEILPIISTKNDASFLIDITTFTRQTLLILLRLLRNILTDVNKLDFIYAPAKEYSVGLPYKDKWLTKGILGVSSVLGFAGVIRPSQPYHLIILLGFEVERASSLIDAYEPSKITIGYSKKIDSLSDENYNLNKEKCEELLCEHPNAEFFEFSSGNISECILDILEQVKKHEKYNVIVSPMNNKISTVACALSAFENNEIQIAIAIPSAYNHENYSSPGDCFHLLDISSFTK